MRLQIVQRTFPELLGAMSVHLFLQAREWMNHRPEHRVHSIRAQADRSGIRRRKMPWLSMKGRRRSAWSRISNQKWEWLDIECRVAWNLLGSDPGYRPARISGPKVLT